MKGRREGPGRKRGQGGEKGNRIRYGGGQEDAQRSKRINRHEHPQWVGGGGTI